MIFGKINYINLLPFHVFLKKEPLQNSFKKSISCKQSFPAHLNTLLKKRKIGAAFISSIASTNRNLKTINAGIVAKKDVQSVLVKPDGLYRQDPHSATSNVLAKILNLNGEVIIGDRALKAYIKNKNSYIDMAKVWTDKYKTPFVFARLSVNEKYHFYKKLGEKFANEKIFIPRYILDDYVRKREIGAENIKEYLTKISYKIDSKAQRGLYIFLRKCRLSNNNNSKEFYANKKKN